MKQILLRTSLVLLVATLAVMAGAGCRTANGFGQDLEKAGEEIQSGTK